jgi:hypothetical protein
LWFGCDPLSAINLKRNCMGFMPGRWESWYCHVWTILQVWRKTQFTRLETISKYLGIWIGETTIIHEYIRCNTT